jgi:hypothetical protein
MYGAEFAQNAAILGEQTQVMLIRNPVNTQVMQNRRSLPVKM